MSNTTEKEERFIRLPLDLHQQVASAAHAEDRTIASMLRVLVREGLKHRTNIGDRDPSGEQFPMSARARGYAQRTRGAA